MPNTDQEALDEFYATKRPREDFVGMIDDLEAALVAEWAEYHAMKVTQLRSQLLHVRSTVDDLYDTNPPARG